MGDKNVYCHEKQQLIHLVLLCWKLQVSSWFVILARLFI